MPREPDGISAVITNFNYGRFLPRAIESLLNQTAGFVDIAVVDDGSTDFSSEVLAKYEGRVRVIRGAHRGLMTVSLEGLDATRASYVYLLDADDFAMPGLVERLLPLLSASPAKIQFQLLGVDEAGHEIGSRFPYYPTGYASFDARRDNISMGFYICPPTSGNVYKREYLEMVRPHLNDIKDAIDGTPALVMPYLGEIVSLNEPLAYYRVHQSSESGWSNPTPARLQGELDRFQRRWAAAAGLVGDEAPNFEKVRPLFVLEREMMMAVQNGHKLGWGEIAQYIIGLWKTNIRTKQKVLLSAWGVCLLLPLERMRRSLIEAKRSPSRRPKIVKAVTVMAGRSDA